MTTPPQSPVALDGAREVGLDPDRLARAFGLIERWVEEGVLPAAAAIVLRGGRIAGEAYVGRVDRARQQAASPDTIWSLASITKPVTAAAIVRLVERGVLSLDEPVHRAVPEFLDTPVSPFDRTAVTLRHLLAHCSGLPGFSPENLALRRDHRPLVDFVRPFISQPLLFAPGALHYYSNCGILLAAEVAARAITGALGQCLETPAVSAFHDFVHQEILAPLGMRDSSLLPPVAWDERIAWVAGTGQDGTSWEAANSRYYRTLGIPWGGLMTTARDLMRFVDPFVAHAAGRQPATSVLSPAGTRAMTTVQFAPPEAPNDLAPALRDAAPYRAPHSTVPWGLGWEIKGPKRPQRFGDLTSPATFGHLGATGTVVWADPSLDLACCLVTNRAMADVWTTERPRQSLFANAVMAAVQ